MFVQFINSGESAPVGGLHLIHAALSLCPASWAQHGPREASMFGGCGRQPAATAVRDVLGAGPGAQVSGGPGVDDALARHTAFDGARAAVALPVQLTRGVRV